MVTEITGIATVFQDLIVSHKVAEVNTQGAKNWRNKKPVSALRLLSVFA
jgi:hypothetical protein